MDKILLRNLMFYGYHGVYEAERELGQKFYLDIELAADLEKAGYSDDLMDTIDYTAVYREVK
ncbi:MAG: dihydroneopterin aldolase, partial [Selenomonadales bacterium]|nr:dihydroneopterin aldolase [Selenomonadales bacterium]